MNNMPKQDVAKIAGAAIVMLLAVILIYRFYSSQQVHVVQQLNVPPGSSEKGQAMKGQEGSGESPSDNIDPSKMKKQ